MAKKITKKDIFKKVKEEKIEFIELWFTDILGFLKGVTIDSSELKRVLDGGSSFDGSSVEGFARIEESDMIAKPDLNTFRVLSWRRDQEKTARLFCDVCTKDGKPFLADPRYILKKNLKEARKKGYRFFVGPELEFFYFKTPDGTTIIDSGGYFDLAPLDVARELKMETVSALKGMGVPVEYVHHEVSASQHEIDLKYGDALEIADNVMTARLVTKEIARKHGFYATFMPKPKVGLNGSGMHVHLSLASPQGKNLFYDKKDKYNLSKIGKGFIEGLLRRASDITSITNQWVNSYKRLIPGYEAPVYICWAHVNRSALVRVPAFDNSKSARVEYRVPDPACNPYLVFSVILEAGLDGIKSRKPLRKPATDNIYGMEHEQRQRSGIKSLPEDLLEAIKYTEKSTFVKNTLGEELFYYFIRNKRVEWDEYRKQVFEYELDKYLPIL